MVRAASVSLGLTDPFFTQFSFDQVLAKLNIQNLAGGLFSSTISLLGNILFVLFFFVFVLSGNEMIYKAIEHRYVFNKVNPELEKLKADIKNDDVTVDDQKIIDRISEQRKSREQQLETTFQKIKSFSYSEKNQ